MAATPDRGDIRRVRRLILWGGAGILAAVVAVSLLRGADTPPAPALPEPGPAAEEPLTGTLQPAEGSFVGYRVDETLIGIGLNTAVGRTGRLRGSARFAGGRIVAARLETDTGTLRSDEARRDEALRTRGLETDRYPTARFVLSAPARVAGRFGARGRLALHGRTRPVRVRLQSRRAGAGIDLVGSAPIELADYGMEPPSVAGVASVRDHGVLEFRLRLR
jgi:polyisoprenoid-binding protein YceI